MALWCFRKTLKFWININHDQVVWDGDHHQKVQKLHSVNIQQKWVEKALHYVHKQWKKILEFILSNFLSNFLGGLILELELKKNWWIVHPQMGRSRKTCNWSNFVAKAAKIVMTSFFCFKRRPWNIPGKSYDKLQHTLLHQAKHVFWIYRIEWCP